MSFDQIQTIPNKDRALVIINAAAIEQHGHHLPLGTDAYLGQGWLEGVLPKISKKNPVYVAHPITVARSLEHINFPGTLTLSVKSFQGQLLHAVQQVCAWGFSRLLILSTHGGNISAIQCVLEPIEKEVGIRLFFIPWYPRPKEPTERYDIHAGEIETSWMLACSKDRVCLEKAINESPPYSEPTHKLQPASKPACFAWMSSDLSYSGVLGPASQGTEAKGVAWMEQGISDLARKIEGLFDSSL